jgi:hypothetical protein
MTHEDPFAPMNMHIFNAGIVIREGLKSLIESFVDSNDTLVSCTDMDRLLLIVEELEIAHSPIDNNGDVDRSGAPLVLARGSDPRSLFNDHIARSIMNQIKQPHRGPITFQKEFVYVFSMSALHIKMPPNWKRDKVLDADEITSPQVLGVKEKIRATTSSKTTSSSTHPSDDMMQQLIDAQILLAKNLDASTFG